ncbi:MAG TPA: DUF2079 domain-containing protein [Candidatus Brocadiia bacterium]|nr:DUF2079 domain-containing protein [Candidatus Brocadiia bacterium]
MAGKIAEAFSHGDGVEVTCGLARKHVIIVSLIGSLIAAAWYADVPSSAHRGHLLNFCDAGIYTEVVKNTAQGRFLASDGRCDGGSYLQDHFCPILAALAPFYNLFNGPGVMIWAHSLAIAAGAVPLALLALHLGIRPASCILLCAAYWLYPFMTQLSFCDGRGPHAEGLALPFIFASFFFAARRNWIAFAVFAVIASLAKEDVPLVYFFFGRYLTAFEKERRVGGGIATSAFLGFILVAGVIMPNAAGEAGYRYVSRYAGLGDGIVEIVLSPVLKPQIFWPRLLGAHSWMLLLWLTAPLCFIPWRAWRFLSVGLGIFLMTVLQDDPNMASVGLHYHTHLIPILFTASVMVLTGRNNLVDSSSACCAPTVSIRLAGCRVPARCCALAAALAISCFAGQYIYGASRFSAFLDPGYVNPSPIREAINKQVRELIPASAAVVATDIQLNNLLHCRKTFRYVSRHRIPEADYIVIDLAETGNRAELVEYYADLRESGALAGFGLVYAKLGVLVFKKGDSGATAVSEIILKGLPNSSTRFIPGADSHGVSLNGYEVVPMPLFPSGRGLRLYWADKIEGGKSADMFKISVIGESGGQARYLAHGTYFFGEGYALPRFPRIGHFVTDTIPLIAVPREDEKIHIQVEPAEIQFGLLF